MEGAHQKSVTVPMIIDDETFISDRFGVGGGGGGCGDTGAGNERR